MSVEKFKLTKDETEFTTFPNSLLQGLNNAEALGLYSYLASLPSSWTFYKEQIRHHFKFGRDKLEKLFHILQQFNLIKIYQYRNEKGHFTNWNLHVRSAKHFLPLTDFQGTVSSPLNTGTDDTYPHPFTDSPFTANQLLENSSYKTNKNKTNKNIKKSSCKKTSVDNSADLTGGIESIPPEPMDNSARHEFADSMDQMACEQRHIDEHEARKKMEKGTPMPDELRILLKRLLV